MYRKCKRGTPDALSNSVEVVEAKHASEETLFDDGGLLVEPPRDVITAAVADKYAQQAHARTTVLIQDYLSVVCSVGVYTESVGSQVAALDSVGLLYRMILLSYLLLEAESQVGS